MSRLIVAEMRRALHRRIVRVLILVALAGIAVLGIVAFVDSGDQTVAELGAEGTHPALMADWWIDGTADGILVIAAGPLLIGGLLGGASVAGAEWRAGTVATVLAWEPRRLRLHVARGTSAFLLAAVIAALLQAAFLAATLPAVVAHGSAAGVDGTWWASLAWAGGRLAVLTGLVAVLGVSLATVGRATAFAIGAVFGWMVIGEGLVRSLKPGLQQLLMGENLAIALTWGPIEGASFSRSGVVALATLGAYVAALAALGAVSFVRRDVAAAS